MMQSLILKRKLSVPLIGLGADSLILSAVIVACNLHLMGIGNLDSLIFIPGAVASGEWWRLLTHPFAHVSWYHLCLDASAFLLLYSQLLGKIWGRLTHVGICGAFSLGAAWIWSPDIGVLGLCGLSGIAHGLMAIVSLDMIRTGRDRVLGWVCLTGVVLKSLVETINGGVLFLFIHEGICGTPIVACHLGGVMGGLLSYGLYVQKNRLVDHE